MATLLRLLLYRVTANDHKSELAQSEPEGLSWESVQRIKMLRDMEENFVSGKYEDTGEQLPNIRAILQAYRTKKLAWHPNLVTYWSYGQQLCEPRPFDWDEFEVLNQSHGGSMGFWREGVSGYFGSFLLLLLLLSHFHAWLSCISGANLFHR
jgi:hypothetical protein